MENIKLPLDSNLNPIGVLQPGKQYYIEGSGDSVELPEAGVYMLSFVSGTVVQINYPDGTDSRVVVATGTIISFYFPAGTTVSVGDEDLQLNINKMR
ncbi:hypothetical protein [Barnesiella intestinihominis]|uniref:hypothetical protein n=1 Tax=Barnesiella intestinihominis TaxID=487174 RepID=UPI00204EB179|nr:MAG TPA: hypothetical protein [Caudoviricetes sp.]